MHLQPLLLFLQAFTLALPSVVPDAPASSAGLELLDPTLPSALPAQTPKCTVAVLDHAFAVGVASLPVVSINYTQPPECPAPWTRVVLEVAMAASGLARKHRVAAVWLDGVEILRTSTPPLLTAADAFWRVQKDVTSYAAIINRLAGGGTVSMIVDNSAVDLAAVLAANVSFHFYRGELSASSKHTGHPSLWGLYREPADLVIPISRERGSYGSGFWFQISGNPQAVAAPVTVPRNTYRAVLEIFVSYHADDESWYMNPLRFTYNARDVAASTANGGFRQLYATVDGRFVGGHVPYAVIYSSSINPYFWSPVTAIGTFDIPTHDIDLTPFLGLLLDGRPHELAIGVKDAQKYWLLSANLHLWVDRWSDAVQAGIVEYTTPTLKVNRNAQWHNQDGHSEVDAEGQLRFVGWVSSSKGNMTTTVGQKLRFKSQVSVHNRGAVRQVDVVNREKTTVTTKSGQRTVGKVQLLMEAPLQVQTSVVRVAGGPTFENTRLSHQLQETAYVKELSAVSMSKLSDRQEAEGSAMVHEEEAQWGIASTRSYYKYTDENSCYLRTVNAEEGAIKVDMASRSCSAISDA
ncbi:unnamed protein product [Musa hybrid cultivar]